MVFKSIFRSQTVKITTFEKRSANFSKIPKISVFCTFWRCSAASACDAFLPFFDMGDRNYSVLALSGTKMCDIGRIEKKLWNFQFWVTNPWENRQFWANLGFWAKISKFAPNCHILIQIIIFLDLNHQQSYFSAFPPKKTQHLIQRDEMKKIPIFSKNRIFFCSSACSAVQALVAKNFVGDRKSYISSTPQTKNFGKRTNRKKVTQLQSLSNKNVDEMYTYIRP